MFVGHYAVALGVNKAAPEVPLGTLVFAAQLVDLIWPILLLLGVERVRIDPGNTAFTPLDFTHYPITHSLVGAVVWSALFGLVYLARRRRTRAAVIVGLAVFSHWVLDLLTHRPDLPLVPGSPVRVGLGLWNSVPGTLVVELGLFAVGAALYLRTTRARDRVGRYALWSLLVVLMIIYTANVIGPPPPNPTTIAVAGLGLWLFVPWAYWIDRHRDRAPGRPRLSARPR
jgi:membrane-bound metal-dependent hydrolase YbcI (DUF457 family)